MKTQSTAMGARILIVEDEEPLTLLLRYNLEAEGYQVDVAARGDDAEIGLKEGLPDLVVLDWMLPGVSGIELWRRRRAHSGRIVSLLQIGDLELDRDRRRVSRAGRDVHLGPTEFRLLEHLMQSAGRVFSRGQLLDGVWGRDVYIDERTVDVHVGRLRRALNRGGAPDPIRTVRGGGYAFDDRFGDRGSVTGKQNSELGNAGRS